MDNNIQGEAKKRQERTQWFRNARFGMFIHWGLYAIPARGEWLRSVEEIPVEAYDTYFQEFNPTEFNAPEWASSAKKARMQYVVLTAKHHDGFCLFDSALTDYKVTNTPFGKDIVKEYADACRAEGLKVGLYYSLLDWHHPDYPVNGDIHHPMRNHTDTIDPACQDWNRYLDYMHGQVKELCTNYGDIDIMWFDFSYEDMTKEKWKAAALTTMVRTLQPNIIINNRLGGDIKSDSDVTAGDFTTPEQIIPPKGLTDYNGHPVPWEACVTHNGNWGYAAHDLNYKTSRNIIRSLVECVSKGGNMLLNIGPDAKGRFPARSLCMLNEVSEWMSRNGKSIFNCTHSQYEKPEWGRLTQNGNVLYAHVLDKGITPVYLNDIKDKVKSVRLLSDGSEINFETPWFAYEYPDILFINMSGADLPDMTDTVLQITLAT